MSDLRQKTLLLALIEKMNEAGSWCGETHIQKVAYFLQKGFGGPLNYDFLLYKHGPFSFDLRDDLSEMRSNGFVEVSSNCPYGSSFHVGNNASTLKELFQTTISEYDELLSSVAKTISPFNVSELEKISTALYVCGEERIDDPSACAIRINSLKPHITLEEAESAAKKVKVLVKND